jgi:hypothetical protein
MGLCKIDVLIATTKRRVDANLMDKPLGSENVALQRPTNDHL